MRITYGRCGLESLPSSCGQLRTATVTTFSTSSRARGARRAVAGRRTGIAPREPTADSNAAQHPPAAGRPPGGRPWRAGRRLPSFGPGGPRRRRRALTPPATARAARPNIGSGARGHGGGPSLRRPHREALQDQPLGRSLRSRRCAMPLAPLRLSLGRDSLGANRRDGRVRTLAGPVATACSKHPEPCRSQAVTTGGESHVRYRAGHIGRVLQAGGQGFKSP